MLLMNPHPHYVRINPFADPQTIGWIESELQGQGGTISVDDGEKRYGFHSFSRRDSVLERQRARFGRASVEAEDGPYYLVRPLRRGRSVSDADRTPARRGGGGAAVAQGGPMVSR